MAHDYRRLLETAYEIEGLLTLQSTRGDDAPEAVDRMIACKLASLAHEFGLNTREAVPTDDAAARAVAASALNEERLMAAARPAVDDDDETYDPALDKRPVTTVADKVAPDAITIDEKLARQRARNISKAFTLNDRFRFRRELFRDSQQEFDDVLGVIAQMSTLDEAREYIYDDLCWDPSSEPVKEFMDVVSRHF